MIQLNLKLTNEDAKKINESSSKFDVKELKEKSNKFRKMDKNISRPWNIRNEK